MYTCVPVLAAGHVSRLQSPARHVVPADHVDCVSLQSHVSVSRALSDALQRPRAHLRSDQPDLRHNPLATHPRHRDIASSWLNPSLASTSPVLNSLALSRSELLQVGSSRLIISPSVSHACPTSGDNTEHNDTIDELPESASVTGSIEGSYHCH